jgi:hypothetical protein
VGPRAGAACACPLVLNSKNRSRRGAWFCVAYGISNDGIAWPLCPRACAVARRACFRTSSRR